MVRDSTTRDIDKGQDFIVRQAKNIKGSFVKVGLQGESGQKPHGATHDAATVVDVGVFNEFGAPRANVPERSFIRSTHDEKKGAWSALTKASLNKILALRLTADKALGVIGLRIQNDIKFKIRSGVPPPNEPSTLRRKLAKTAGTKRGQPRNKRKPVTLIDKGQMLNSIIFVKFMS